MESVLPVLYAVLAVLGVNVIVNMGVWFRIGGLTAEVTNTKDRVEKLEARAVSAKS